MFAQRTSERSPNATPRPQHLSNDPSQGPVASPKDEIQYSDRRLSPSVLLRMGERESTNGGPSAVTEAECKHAPCRLRINAVADGRRFVAFGASGSDERQQRLAAARRGSRDTPPRSSSAEASVTPAGSDAPRLEPEAVSPAPICVAADVAIPGRARARPAWRSVLAPFGQCEHVPGAVRRLMSSGENRKRDRLRSRRVCLLAPWQVAT